MKVLVAFAIAMTAAGQLPTDYERGRAALEHGDAAAAVKSFERAVSLAPGNARYHYELGNAYGRAAMAAGMFRAMSIAGKAKANGSARSRSTPTSCPAHFRIGQAAASAGADFTRGERALKKYLTYGPKEEEPARARAWYWLGAIYEKQHRPTDAKASYTGSLRIDPTQTDVVNALKRVS